jgi:outer membrane protein OmpA-like peptidoglycan-associated protein
MPARALESWNQRLALTARTGRGQAPPGAATGSAIALVLGCLVGLLLSWQGVLSDGARARVYRLFTGLDYTATAIAGPPLATAGAGGPSSQGMADVAYRLSEKPLAVWPKSTAGSTQGMDTRSPEPPPQTPLGSLDQLTLAEDNSPVLERVAAVGAPAAGMEITFDVNSSFLRPDTVGMLKELVARLPDGAAPTLGLRATVSDDGVKSADASAAYRYNRWLAERRLERVRHWLAEHGPTGLTVEPGFLDHDASRRVVVAFRQGP